MEAVLDRVNEVVMLETADTAFCSSSARRRRQRARPELAILNTPSVPRPVSLSLFYVSSLFVNGPHLSLLLRLCANVLAVQRLCLGYGLFALASTIRTLLPPADTHFPTPPNPIKPCTSHYPTIRFIDAPPSTPR